MAKESDKKTTGGAAKKAATSETKNNSQSVVIAVLSTVLVCFVVAIGVLLCTGVIKFGDENTATPRDDTTGKVEKNDNKKTGDEDEIIDNPNTQTKESGTKVSVKDLEFYLPSAFKAGGKNDDGAYTYNLTDDDGWAQVLVYAEKSSLTASGYLMKISSYLDITDRDYEISGTSWVIAENGSVLAYATKLDGVVYAVYYSVKVDSEATSKAMRMIPKTLYMKKVYSNKVD